MGMSALEDSKKDDPEEEYRQEDLPRSEYRYTVHKLDPPETVTVGEPFNLNLEGRKWGRTGFERDFNLYAAKVGSAGTQKLVGKDTWSLGVRGKSNGYLKVTETVGFSPPGFAFEGETPDWLEYPDGGKDAVINKPGEYVFTGAIDGDTKRATIQVKPDFDPEIVSTTAPQVATGGVALGVTVVPSFDKLTEVVTSVDGEDAFVSTVQPVRGETEVERRAEVGFTSESGFGDGVGLNNSDTVKIVLRDTGGNTIDTTDITDAVGASLEGDYRATLGGVELSFAGKTYGDIPDPGIRSVSPGGVSSGGVSLNVEAVPSSTEPLYVVLLIDGEVAFESDRYEEKVYSGPKSLRVFAGFTPDSGFGEGVGINGASTAEVALRDTDKNIIDSTDATSAISQTLAAEYSYPVAGVEVAFAGNEYGGEYNETIEDGFDSEDGEPDQPEQPEGGLPDFAPGPGGDREAGLADPAPETSPEPAQPQPQPSTEPQDPFADGPVTVPGIGEVSARTASLLGLAAVGGTIILLR